MRTLVGETGIRAEISGEEVEALKRYTERGLDLLAPVAVGRRTRERSDDVRLSGYSEPNRDRTTARISIALASAAIAELGDEAIVVEWDLRTTRAGRVKLNKGYIGGCL